MYQLAKEITGSILIVLLLCSGAFAGKTHNAEHSRILNKALEALSQSKIQEALELARPLLTKKTPHSMAYLITGNALMQLDKVEEALSVYKKGVNAYPKDEGLLQNYAIASYRTENYKEAGNAFYALFQYQQAGTQKGKSSSKPQASPAWQQNLHQAAVCFYKAQAYSRAQKAVSALVHHLGMTKEYCTLSAHIYIAQKNWTAAARQLKNALKYQPEDAKTWRLVAELHIRSKQIKKAASALQIANILAPPTERSQMRLAQAYLQVNAPLLACRALQKTPGKLSAKYYDLLAAAYQQAGRDTLAAKSLQHAIDLTPTPKRYLELAKIHFHNQQYKHAIPPLQKAIAENEKSGLAHYLLGQCYWRDENLPKAIEAFSQASSYKLYRFHANSCLQVIRNLQQRNDIDRG